jgi:hypothetical protein
MKTHFADDATLARLVEIEYQRNELYGALRLCYDHCRLYHPEVETNNVGEVVRAALAKAQI